MKASYIDMKDEESRVQLLHLAQIAKWQHRIQPLWDGRLFVIVAPPLIALKLLHYSNPFFLITLFFIPSLIGLGICLWTISSASKRRNIIFQLDDIDDIFWMGTLLEAYGFDEAIYLFQPERSVSNAVGDAIKRLLRKIDTDQKCTLNPRERELLRRLLFPVCDMHNKTNYDLNLVWEVLRTLSHIGEQADADAIKRLMRNKNLEPNLRETARLSLSRIEERLASQQPHATLLRAAASTSRPDEMLRPVAARPQTASEDVGQLLHPLGSEVISASNMDNAFLPNAVPITPSEPLQQVQLGRQAEKETP